MKPYVDHDRCEGHAKCQAAAPGVFEVRDDDLSYVLVDDVKDDDTKQRVDRAIRLCPRSAISWVE